ncbi:MAG: DUF1015 family protein [Streptosporangiaceae bacterium]
MILLTYVQILPSGQAVAQRRQAGLALAPFRGIRYAEDKVSDLAKVTSPPYDVIAGDKEDQLLAADPHNVVRLILPRHQAGQPGDLYRDAAQTLARWQQDGILVADPAPALYVYEQTMPSGPGAAAHPLVQRGLIGALRLADPQAGIVLPHEDVAPGPVADRRRLMEATQANLEPIFLLYDGSEPGAATRLVDETAARRPALLETLTADGAAHRLWAISDPDDLAAIADDLAPRQALIADGHHRYAAYRGLQERRHQAGEGPGPWDFGLAMLVDSASYPPQIAAIHRVIPGMAPAAAAEKAAAAFRVRPLPGGAADLSANLAELASAAEKGPAFLLAGGGSAFLLTDPDPAQADAAMPAGLSPRWRGLAPAVLQELLIGRLWGITDNERTIRVVHDDAAAAVRAADEAPGGTAVISRPVSDADVYAVAALGERMPRKATSFAPKPRTGVVIRTFTQS